MTFPLTRSRSRARFFGTPFSPVSLFANGEQGAWYDPSDATTLFQDAAGTTPTTMETRARLMLDKSKGLVLGPELVTNGDFSSGTTGWAGTNATLAVVGGQLEVTATASSNMYAGQTISVAVGKTYKFTATIRAPSANTGVNAARSYLYTTSSLGVSILTGASFAATAEDVSLQITGIFTATDVTVFVQLGVGSSIAWGSSGDKAYFDNISIRELPGNHAVAPSDASSPILRARYNLLQYSEDFTNAYWTPTGVASRTANAATATLPTGQNVSLTRIVEDSGNTAHRVISASIASVIAGATYKASAVIKGGGVRNWLYLRIEDAASNFLWFNATTGATGTVSAGLTNVSVTSLGSGAWLVSCTRVVSGSIVQVMTGHAAADNAPVYTGDGSAWFESGGADFRTSVDAALNIPAYQRIGAATDYDTNGFPVYTDADGSDDGMSTASIDFTGTDKVTVFAGVTKLSDAARAMLVELGNGITNRFSIEAPDAALGNFLALCGGTSQASVAVSAAAPISRVLTLQNDISADNLDLRVNGVSNISTGDQGTGTYANAPVFLFSRNNASLRFRGRVYSLIIRGASTTTPLIASTEQWVAGKMRLPI